MEQLYNLITGALANSVSADAVNIPLTPASLLPTGGTYRILVDAELMIVNSKAGNTISVVRGAEGTIATTHAANAICYVIASAGGLLAVRQQSVEHINPLLHKVIGSSLALFGISLDLLTANRTLLAPNKSGIIATLDDIASGGLSPATGSTLGGVMVGAGLAVTNLGLLSANISAVNGQTNGAIVLDADDVGAIDLDSIDVPGGVAGISALPSNSPENLFLFGRTDIKQLPFGAVQVSGTWNPSINSASDYINLDGFTYTVELIDGGSVRLTRLGDDFEAEVPGWIYEVTTPATVDLDDYEEFFLGDLLVSLNGKWQKMRSADNDVAAALAAATAAQAAASDAVTQASEAYNIATAQPVSNITDATADPFVLGSFPNKGHIFVDRTAAEGNIDIELPTDDTDENITTGYTVTIHQIGDITGTVTLVLEDGGVQTITGKTATTSVGDYIRLVKRAADTWYGY